MIDIAMLAASALTAAYAYLGREASKVADEATTALGSKVVDWLRAKLISPAEDEALKKAEANPDSQGARKMLEGALMARLEEDSALASDLEKLLSLAGTKTIVTQTMSTTGDNNVSAQVAGSGNTVSTGRP